MALDWISAGEKGSLTGFQKDGWAHFIGSAHLRTCDGVTWETIAGAPTLTADPSGNPWKSSRDARGAWTYDSGGDVWLYASDGNIYVYDGSSWSLFGAAPGATEHGICWHGGTLYAASGASVYYYSGGWNLLGSAATSPIAYLVSHGGELYAGRRYIPPSGSADMAIYRWDGASFIAEYVDISAWFGPMYAYGGEIYFHKFESSYGSGEGVYRRGGGGTWSKTSDNAPFSNYGGATRPYLGYLWYTYAESGPPHYPIAKSISGDLGSWDIEGYVGDYGIWMAWDLVASVCPSGARLYIIDCNTTGGRVVHYADASDYYTVAQPRTYFFLA